MINKFLESEDLLYEPLEEKHITHEYISWLNNNSVTRFNSHGIYENTIYKTKEYVLNIQNDKSCIVLAMIEKKSLIHIGNVSIQSIDLINSNADLAILIGDNNAWGKGYATQAFSILISHCFNKLNLHKVTAGTTSDNISMQKVLEKLDFTKEANLRESIKRDASYFDIYKYGLINPK